MFSFLFLNYSAEFKRYVCNKTNSEEIMKNFAKVTIFNKHMYVTKTEEVEAYSLDQLFSDIGELTSFIPSSLPSHSFPPFIPSSLPTQSFPLIMMS